MFKTMRRPQQALPEEEIEDLLKKGTYLTLALNGADGYPYSVPVNYLYDNHCLYFHGSIVGYKTECLKNNAKVSFSIVFKDEVDPINRSTLYQSIIGFGTARFLEGAEKIQKALQFGYRFCRGYEEGVREEVYSDVPFNLIEIKIEHLTAKESKGLHDLRIKNLS